METYEKNQKQLTNHCCTELSEAQTFPLSIVNACFLWFPWKSKNRLNTSLGKTLKNQQILKRTAHSWKSQGMNYFYKFSTVSTVIIVPQWHYYYYDCSTVTLLPLFQSELLRLFHSGTVAIVLKWQCCDCSTVAQLRLFHRTSSKMPSLRQKDYGYLDFIKEDKKRHIVMSSDRHILDGLMSVPPPLDNFPWTITLHKIPQDNYLPDICSSHSHPWIIIPWKTAPW